MSWNNLANAIRPLGGRKLDEESKRYTKPYILNNGETVTSRSALKDPRNVHNLTSGTLHTRLARGGKWLNPEMLWSPPNPSMSRGPQQAKKNRK